MNAGYMTGIYARTLIDGFCSVLSLVFKLTLVLAVLLSPYALEYAFNALF